MTAFFGDGDGEMGVGDKGAVVWILGSTGCGGVKYWAKPVVGDSQEEKAEKPTHSTQKTQESKQLSPTAKVTCVKHASPAPAYDVRA